MTYIYLRGSLDVAGLLHEVAAGVLGVLGPLAGPEPADRLLVCRLLGVLRPGPRVHRRQPLRAVQRHRRPEKRRFSYSDKIRNISMSNFNTIKNIIKMKNIS